MDAWDTAGRKTKQTRDNVVTTYVYDNVNRQTGIQYGDGTAVTYAYDAVGNRTMMQDSGGTTTYAYTSRNEVTRVSLPGSLVSTYTYDSVGNRDLMMDPDGGRHPYTYGSSPEVGLIKTIEVPGGNKLTLTYTAGTTVSLVSNIQDWGGRRRAFQYDAAGYLTTFTTPLGCVTKYGYSSAGAGLGTSMVHTIEDPRGYATMYMYDAYKRVVSMASGSAVWTYTYNSGQFGEATAGLRKDYLANAPDSVRIASKMGSQILP